MMSLLLAAVVFSSSAVDTDALGVLLLSSRSPSSRRSAPAVRVLSQPWGRQSASLREELGLIQGGDISKVADRSMTAPEYTEAEKSQIVKAIEDQQHLLLERFEASREEVQGATKRLNVDLTAATRSNALLEDLQQRISTIKDVAQSDTQIVNNLGPTRASMVDEAATIGETVEKTSESLAGIGTNIDQIQSLGGADVRVAEGLRTIDILEPRLRKVESDLDEVEQKLGDGVSATVARIAGQQITNVAEDVGRALVAELPS